MGEKKRVLGQHLGFALDGIMPVKLADESHRFLVSQSGCPPFQAGYTGHRWVIRYEIHLLVHPDVVINIRLFVNASGRHGEQAKSNDHLFLHPRFLRFPICDAINKFLQGVLRTLLARHFMQVPFQGHTIPAVHNRSDEICADYFLVQLFAAAPHIGIQNLILVPFIRADSFDGLAVHFVLLSFLLDSSATFGSHRLDPF